MDTPQISAPAALAAWIAAKTGRRQRLAERLSVSTSTVWRWASGRAVPMRVVRPRIERITRGRVAACAWDVQP